MMTPVKSTCVGITLQICLLTAFIVSGCKLIDDIPPPIPEFTPGPAMYYEPLEVAITADEPDCRIYFTTDGSDPYANGDLYRGPLPVDSHTAFKAVAVDAAGNRSPVAMAVYSFGTDPFAPVISAENGAFSENTIITLTAAPDTAVYYTFKTDGAMPSVPTKSDIPYSDGILLSAIPGESLRYRYAFKAFSDITSDESHTVYRDWTVDRSGEMLLPAESFNAVLDIPAKQITGVSIAMEYSTDNGAGWTDCGGAVVDVDLSIGNRVWVRSKTDTSKTQYLGEVLATNGPDLIGGDFLYMGTGFWSDEHIAVPGATHSIFFAPSNIGTETIDTNTVTVEFYLSEDRVITGDDVLLASQVYPYAIGLDPPENGYPADFVVPDTPGEYYVGMVIDTAGSIDELNEENNCTIPSKTAYFVITDNASPAVGAVKIVNSWGVGGSWENKPDGHYWLTYETAKSLQLYIRYYHNDFTAVYEPRVLAVFNITHPRREECKVIFGLGTPESPYMMKEFQMRWSDDIQSGPEPFPANDMALDLSEFSEAVGDFDLFLRVENSGGTAGMINSFAVEFYSDYDQAPFKTLSGSQGTAIPADGLADVSIGTSGSLSGEELLRILALPRAGAADVVLHEEKPDAARLAADKQIVGVYEEGRDYNLLYEGRYGTGYQPPSEEDWDRMVRLLAVETMTPAGDIPLSVDHSLTRYFPPVGTQGIEGSCTAFSFAYYIHTYTEAREHGWDLSGARWMNKDPSGGDNQGGPSAAYADKIFSPDFVYHAINDGVDSGSSGGMAATLLARIGCATWAEMPYDTTDSTSWPSEAAFREAARYRAREVNENPYYEYSTGGYFTIEDDSDIQMLKMLLSAGYCVQTSIHTDGLYELFDSNDVVSGYTGGPMSTNHAQTIVGYKEGGEWDETVPDG